MEKEKCKKTEIKDVILSFRVTKSLKKFIDENRLVPSKIMIEAVKQLGYQKSQ